MAREITFEELPTLPELVRLMKLRAFWDPRRRDPWTVYRVQIGLLVAAAGGAGPGFIDAMMLRHDAAAGSC